MKAILFLLSFVFATTVFARLCETESQCDRRYGSAIGVYTNTPYVCRIYCTNGFCVMAYFNLRAAVMLHVTKRETPSDDSEKITAEELGILLKANSRGHEWHEVDNETAVLRSKGLKQDELIQRSISFIDWVQQDGSWAVYGKQSHVLIMMSPEGAALAAKEKLKSTSLDGF